MIWDVYYATTRESNARDYHPDLIGRWAPEDQDMDEWSARLTKTNPFVAIVDERIVGMAEIEPSGFIDYFYVHPRFQGRGVGKELLASVLAEAEALGLTEVFANVSVTAQSFFACQGFVVTEERSNIILGHPAPNFAMTKNLKSEQGVAPQSATRPESDSEGSDNPQPDSEERSR